MKYAGKYHILDFDFHTNANKSLFFRTNPSNLAATVDVCFAARKKNHLMIPAPGEYDENLPYINNTRLV